MIEMTPSYVYVIAVADDSRSKIGVSDDPEARLKGLQTGNSEVLRISFTQLCESRGHAFVLEKAVHEAIKDARLSGEWFSVSPRDAEAVIVETISAIDFENASPRIRSDIERGNRIAEQERKESDLRALQAEYQKSIEDMRELSKRMGNQLVTPDDGLVVITREEYDALKTLAAKFFE